MEQPPVSISKPPFPEILIFDEGVGKQILLLDYDMLHELKNV